MAIQDAGMPSGPSVQPMSWGQRFGFAMLGFNPDQVERDRAFAPGRELADTARIQATASAIEDELRRRQADDAAQAMVEQRLGLPPGGFQAGMAQASLEQAQLGTQVKMTQLGILQDKLKKAQEDPIDFVMSQIYHKLADKGVLMDDPDELRQYATTQSKINNAVQAQAYQKDQAIEQILSQAAATTGLPVTLEAKRQTSATFDSLTQKFGVPPDAALQMLGSSLTPQTLGMPAQPGFGRGLATLPAGGVPQSFGAEAFASTKPEPDLFQRLNSALGPGQTTPTLASVKARINKPKDAGDARRIGTILRSEGIGSVRDLERLRPEQLQLLWQRIEGGL